MLDLRRELVSRCGLDLIPEEALDELVGWLQGLLETMLAERLSCLSDDQLDEFNALVEVDAAAARAWVDATLPDLQGELRRRSSELLDVLASSRDRVIRAAGGAQADGAVPAEGGDRGRAGA